MKKHKKSLYTKLTAMLTSLVMMCSIVSGNAMTLNALNLGERSSVFFQFYAQNQEGSWEWMSTASENLVLGEAITLDLSTIDEQGESIFTSATDTAAFGVQFGDGALKVGDSSKVDISIDTITIKATGYEDLVIDLEPKTFNESYLAKEVEWGITDNATTIALKDYLGEDFLAHLQAITSIQTTVTLNSYSYTAKQTEEIEEPTDEVIFFEGEASSAGSWGQAVSLNAGTDFKVSQLVLGTQIAVTYEGEREPELILASWSGGASWAKVAPTKVSNGVAYFSYEDYLAAYAAGTEDYAQYNEAFPYLNVIHIGDTGSPLVVKKIVLKKEGEVTVPSYEQGEETTVFCQFYAQNQGGNWEWMAPASTNLKFNEEQELHFSPIAADGSSIFTLSNEGAVFGFQFGDAGIKGGESSVVGVTIDEMIIKAEGYNDVIIHPEPASYSEKYLAEEVAWGIQGNATFIVLKEYLDTDFLSHLNAITDMSVKLTLTDYAKVVKEDDGPEFDPNYTHPTEMRNLKATELVEEMGMGWNLGNTLESLGGETAWGNPKTTKKMIDAVAKAGFKTLRIPISWDDSLGENYTIDPEFMDRVETVVNYALANDMYAIINIHHSYGWNAANVENQEKGTEGYKRLWEQIAERFKDYGDYLIFETMNEPRDGDNWIGYEEAYEVVNAYNAACIETIRKSGGNNKERLVMFPGYAASSDSKCIAAIKIPEGDDHLAVSVHAYSPYSFAMDTSETSQTTWSTQDKRALENIFSLVDKTFIQKGIPVVMGEFASTNKDNLEARVAHAKDYVSIAAKYGVPCIWWDNGAWRAYSNDAMGIFNRRTLEWVSPEIVDAAFEGYNNPATDEEFNPLVIFKGKATSNGAWGQALNFKPDTDFMLSDLIDNSQIAVTYESQNAPELILQSWSGGPNWVKIAPNEVKDGVAYFDYEDMIAAYSAQMPNYNEYNEDLPCLNVMYVGDTGAALKVTKVMIIQSPIKGEITFNGKWQDGSNGELILTNISSETLHNWIVSFEYAGEITTIWNATIESHEGNRYVIKNLGWNQDLIAGASVKIGFVAAGKESASEPSKYHVLSTQKISEIAHYEIVFNKTNSWDNQMTGEIKITNQSSTNIEDWQVVFEFDGEITQLWNGEVSKGQGISYCVKNKGYNASIAPGETISLGFTATVADMSVGPHSFEMIQLSY